MGWGGSVVTMYPKYRHTLQWLIKHIYLHIRVHCLNTNYLETKQGNAIPTASNKNVIGVAEQQKWGSKQGGIIIAAKYTTPFRHLIG